MFGILYKFLIVVIILVYSILSNIKICVIFLVFCKIIFWGLWG